MPDPEERYEIWRKTLPSQVDVADDIDWRDIAERYELAGATILNVINDCASAIVAGPSVPLNLKSLEAAIQREYANQGRVVPGSD